MFLVRDIMYCKPGKARPMVEKMQKLAKLSHEMGMGSMRILTDVSAERYWTVVSEMEVPNLETFTDQTRKSGQDPRFREVMHDYHELVDGGRREIYMIEK